MCCGWGYGGYGGRETPGDIPNPVVKLSSADGTAPVGVWESRTPPDIFIWVVGVGSPRFGAGVRDPPTTLLSCLHVYAREPILVARGRFLFGAGARVGGQPKRPVM